ncbi:MAG: molybdenum ABC transporter ATP-binding protein [Pseudomonadota bacterium]
MNGLAVDIDQPVKPGFRLSIRFEAREGATTALMGPSGSGKTSVLDAIAGLRPDLVGASVSYADSQWSGADQFLASWRRPLAYVFQDGRLLPHLSVQGNLLYARKRALPGGLNLETIIDWFELRPLLNAPATALSAGQRQRVAIARAIAKNPRIMLLDEPLANLDPAAAAQCIRHLRRVRREADLTMLYVSHRIDEVCDLADYLVLMDSGSTVAEGPLTDVLNRLDTGLESNPSAASVLKYTNAQWEKESSLCRCDVGGHWIYVPQRVPTNEGRIRIAAKDVSICRSKPQDTSILNILPVTVAATTDIDAAHLMLRLELDGQSLLARITQKSARLLKLKGGDSVFAQIKSTALVPGD